MKTWQKVGLGVVGLAVIGNLLGDSGEATPAASPPVDSARVRADSIRKYDREFEYLAQELVRKSLKDPKSAEFSEVSVVRVTGVPVVCGEVNAKNGFGGYSGAKGFLVTEDGRMSIEESSDDFAKVWNKLCAGK